MTSNFNRLIVVFALFASFFALSMALPSQSYAQDSIPPEIGRQKRSDPASAPLRMTAEVGLGTLFETIAGSIPLMSGMGIQIHDLVKYRDPNRRPFIVEGTLIATAIVYPAGVAAGAILGGYLTDSKSHYWEPFVGAYAGALIADLTAYFLQKDYPVFSALLVIILPIITTTIAIETSHERRKSADKSSNRAYMPLSLQFTF